MMENGNLLTNQLDLPAPSETIPTQIQHVLVDFYVQDCIINIKCFLYHVSAIE